MSHRRKPEHSFKRVESQKTMTMDNLDYSSDPDSQFFCLRWNNHNHNFVSLFDQLYKTECLTDVTLSTADGPPIKCHKTVLAASSPYFHDMFKKHGQEPAVCVFQGIKYDELKAVIDYVYEGQVSLTEEMFGKIMEIGQDLKIKGLDKNLEPAYEKKPVHEEPIAPKTPLATDLSNLSKISTPNNGFSPANLSATLEAFNTPFGHAMMDRRIPQLWGAFPGLQIPQLPTTNHQPRSSYENSDCSPLSRKKQLASRENTILRNVLVQREEVEYERHDQYSNGNGNCSPNDSDRRNSTDYSESMNMMDTDDKKASPTRCHRGMSRISGNQKGGDSGKKGPWKSYKNYTREDIALAMEAVSKKEMSALQAARKFNVPSRTLYDKLKKAGILPSRSAVARRESSSANESARFPYPTELNGSVYGANRDIKSEDGEDSVNGEMITDHSAIYPLMMMQMQAAAHHRSLRQIERPPPPEDDDMVMDMSTRSTPPSPSVARSDSFDDQVEDLSVKHPRSHIAANLNLIPRSEMNAILKNELKKESDDPVPPV